MVSLRFIQFSLLRALGISITCNLPTSISLLMQLQSIVIYDGISKLLLKSTLRYIINLSTNIFIDTDQNNY